MNLLFKLDGNFILFQSLIQLHSSGKEAIDTTSLQGKCIIFQCASIFALKEDINISSFQNEVRDLSLCLLQSLLFCSSVRNAL